MQEEQNIQNNTQFPEWIPQKRGMSSLAQIAVLLAFTGAGLILAAFAQLIIIIIGVKNFSLFNIEAIMNDPKNIFVMQLGQIVASVCLFVLPAFMFALVSKNKFSSYFRFTGKSSGKLWIMTIGLAFTGLLVSEGLSLLNEAIPLSHHLQTYFKGLEENYNNQMSTMVRLNNFSDYLMAIFVVALLPAICEELFFRGALQQIMVLWTRNAFWGIIITSAIFSAIHLSYYGFLSRFFLGIMLGYVFYYGKNIRLSMLIHFLNNALAITFMYIQLHQQHKTMKEVVNSNSGVDFYYIIISAVVFVYLFLRFKKTSEQEIK
ncbi:MAG: CPBP family intramembrane metalloprotease [Chitinophagaceae bacterium]|jgi:membrane protease YdiL (CAAX protease family)|nr:CPBP family intramembrane metalloprotease [Chitinophagaceae bacterium]